MSERPSRVTGKQGESERGPTGPAEGRERGVRPERSTLLVNHDTSPLAASVRPGGQVQAFHRRLPGYAPTPLRDLPELAERLGVGRLLVKDESSRMGLPAFKILGASWATYRVLCDRLGDEPAWDTLDDLAAVVADRLGPLHLVAATDGNHGRAVARMARLLRLSATILVPDGTAGARIDGIASEGADVVVVPGTYDDAVAESAALASAERDVVISDTSWPGYEDTPRRVIEGYSTIFAEVGAQLDRPPDLAMVPLGVGALGASAAACLRAGLEPVDHGGAQLRARVDAGAADGDRRVRRPRVRRRRPLPGRDSQPGRRGARRGRDGGGGARRAHGAARRPWRSAAGRTGRGRAADRHRGRDRSGELRGDRGSSASLSSEPALVRAGARDGSAPERRGSRVSPPAGRGAPGTGRAGGAWRGRRRSSCRTC